MRNQHGMSLVETTIILMVLALLTGIVAPSARAYLEDARNVQAKSDVESIGSAVQNLLRDTGTLCLSFDGASCANTTSGRVELLVSGTSVSANEPTVVSTSTTGLSTSIASAASLNWAGHADEVADARRDLMDPHFVTNPGTGYPTTSFTAGGGPRVGIGWRGPYLTGPIDVDPWGYSYQANTVFLTVASGVANDGTGTGQWRGGWNYDTLVVSAGSNGTIQTAFGGDPATGGMTTAGDDVVYVIQGGTH
jgi:type II secretory pathway pseudopilin PulG